MTSMRDRLQAANAPAWVPTAKGDILTGKVVNRVTRSTDFGEYEIITYLPSSDPKEAPTVGGSTTFKVKTAEGEQTYNGGPLAWHAMGGVAANEVERSDPRPGDEGGVLFDGTGIAQSGVGKGKQYKIFRVVNDKPAPTVPDVAGGDVKPPGPEAAPQLAPADESPYADDEEPF